MPGPEKSLVHIWCFGNCRKLKFIERMGTARKLLLAGGSFSNPEKTALTLEMRNKDDALTWDKGAEADFRLEHSSAHVTGGSVEANKIHLTLSESGATATEVTYSGHPRSGLWFKNGAGIGLLSFWNVPIGK